ncbi:RodZ domain-containing protein [Oceanospirillum sanctuarii]|uniref:RodZ domain-containing protein n=1 Tax=Oceanospirillum sanctuarii TaxID=1434821 RepID=UPI000A3A89D0|nr:RodZ domain-containing protein [Oceanospirillum sanctuarii]
MTDTLATQDDIQADVQLPENMPGEQLKKGRERMQLSTREVSEQLNLKHSFVQMIEDDNYSALPGATFVRGYLRAYAKLVGVDAEALVDAYNANFNEEPKPEERYKPVETIKPQRSFSDPLIKYTTLAVVAALIALSIMWWQSRNGAEPLSLVQSDTVTVETSEGETIIAQMDLSGAEESPITEQVIAVEEGDATEAADAVTENTEVTADDAATETTAVAEEPTPEEIGQAVMGQERFTITFTEECWVEVTDGRDIKVVANLKQAGEESVVEGLPPFKLMIGNAGGAVVTYQGEEVDLKPHTNRNNIARFTLGE